MCEPLHPAAILVARYRTLVRQAFLGAAFYALLLGVGLFWGGDERLQGNSYRAASEVALSVGASPSVLWGSTLFVAGVVALVPVRKVALCGLFAVAAWSTLFALSWIQSINLHPLAGVTGAFAHSFLALVMIGLVVVRLVDPKI